MVALPAAAAGVAVTPICCSPPGAIDRVIGVAMTPLGKEPTATVTFPVKPFTGEAVIVTVCAAPPGVIVIAEGAIARVKSPVAAGDDAEPPPLHPAKTASKEVAHRKVICDCMRSAPTISVTALLLSCRQSVGALSAAFDLLGRDIKRHEQG
jgi:hypothetical protein